MTANDIKNMSDNDLLDMDYFLFMKMMILMTISVKKALYFLICHRLFPMPAFMQALFMLSTLNGGISYKLKKELPLMNNSSISKNILFFHPISVLFASLPSNQGTVAFANIPISNSPKIATIIIFTIMRTT